MTQTKIPQRQIDNNGGWSDYTGTMPTVDSTTDGVDTMAHTTLADTLSKGMKVQLTSGAGTHNYYVVWVSSGSQIFGLAGETSPTGSVTAMKYSYMDSPFGFKRGEDWFKVQMYRGSTISLPTATVQHTYCDSNEYDPNGNYGSGVSNIPMTGYYNVQSVVGLTTAITSGALATGLSVNDVAVLFSCGVIGSGVVSADNVYLLRDDVIKLLAYQNSGATMTINNGLSRSRVTIQFTGI